MIFIGLATTFERIDGRTSAARLVCYTAFVIAANINFWTHSGVKNEVDITLVVLRHNVSVPKIGARQFHIKCLT